MTQSTTQLSLILLAAAYVASALAR